MFYISYCFCWLVLVLLLLFFRYFFSFGWTTAACKELSTSEAWYDAEEDLEPAEPAAAAEMEQSQKVTARDQTGKTL